MQTSAEALNNRGVALTRLMRPDEALQSFAHALACKPDHAEACTNAGNTLKNLQRYDEALHYFERALGGPARRRHDDLEQGVDQIDARGVSGRLAAV